MKGEFAAAISELGAFFDNVGKLARLDLLLLSAELRDSRRSMIIAATMLVTALVIGFFGIALLLTSATLALIEQGFRPTVAALAIAIVVFVIALALALAASMKLKTWSLVPRRTLRQVGENLEALRTSLSDDKHSQP